MPNIRWKFHYFTSDSVSKAENIEGLTDHFTGSDNTRSTYGVCKSLLDHRSTYTLCTDSHHTLNEILLFRESEIARYYFAKAKYYFAKAKYYFAKARYYFAKAKYYFAKTRYYFAKAKYYFAKAKYYFAKARYYFVAIAIYYFAKRNTILR